VGKKVGKHFKLKNYPPPAQASNTMNTNQAAFNSRFRTAFAEGPNKFGFARITRKV